MLYTRYAPLVFHLASQSLDAAVAEDIVQDVFLAVWRKADTFNPRRGTLRAWLLQIAHFRILNEFRRRSRRPQLEPDTDGTSLEDLPDVSDEPAEAAWNSFRREAVRSAVNKLPPAQRQALSLAFFADLTQDQVADLLNVPLGTVKTRIRTAMQSLRLHLAALTVTLALAGALIAGGIVYQHDRGVRQRNERAVSMLASSDTVSHHLAAAPGQSPAWHGSYRSRVGINLSVLAIEDFTAAPAGKTYQGWVLHLGVWVSLGTLTPDANGHGLLIIEDPRLGLAPEAVDVTLEPAGGSLIPGKSVIVSWPAQ